MNERLKAFDLSILNEMIFARETIQMHEEVFKGLLFSHMSDLFHMGIVQMSIDSNQPLKDVLQDGLKMLRKFEI